MEPKLVPLAIVMTSESMVVLSFSSSYFSALMHSTCPQLVDTEGLAEEEVSSTIVDGDGPEDQNSAEEGRIQSAEPGEVPIAFPGEAILSLHKPKIDLVVDRTPSDYSWVHPDVDVESCYHTVEDV